jgi:hypothetical protein
MPLAVGATYVPPPTPPPVQNPGVGDWPTLTWVGGDGSVWPLGNIGVVNDGADLDPKVLDLPGSAYWALPGVQGLGLPPRTITADTAVRSGTSPRNTYRGPRLITLPVYMEADDHATLQALRRAFGQSLESTDEANLGTLYVARPDGTIRLTQAMYQDGFDEDPANPTIQDMVAVTLYCPSPWFFAPNATIIKRAYQSSASNFFSPFLSIGSSETLGVTTVNNPGGAISYPNWVITGPADSITATNVRTGDTFTLDVVAFRGSSLLSSETIVITTDPPTVTGPAGANWIGALDWPGAVLWGLQPGDSEVDFVVPGSAAGTSITLSFTPRFAMA